MAAPHQLPPLPYDESALEPAISARTLSFHYGKHHKAYVDKTNALLEQAPELRDLPLADLVRAVAGDPTRKTLFNNAAQAWNHDFYWKSLTPRAAETDGRLADAIRDAFGDVEACKQALSDAAIAQFGTGWAWLVVRDGKLAVESTGDAGTPITSGATPLLTIDVWEHAYYLDYQNERPRHVAAVEPLLNWRFAAENLG